MARKKNRAPMPFGTKVGTMAAEYRRRRVAGFPAGPLAAKKSAARVKGEAKGGGGGGGGGGQEG